MLRRAIAAVVFTLAVNATASAQDVKPPEIEFGRYHALIIGNNDYEHLRKLTTAVARTSPPASTITRSCRLLPSRSVSFLAVLGGFRRATNRACRAKGRAIP